MEVALGRLLKQALHDQRAAFAEKMKQECAIILDMGQVCTEEKLATKN